MVLSLMLDTHVCAYDTDTYRVKYEYENPHSLDVWLPV